MQHEHQREKHTHIPTHEFIVVKLSPPLGLILASEQDKGAYVEEIVTGGAADKDSSNEVDVFKVET